MHYEEYIELEPNSLLPTYVLVPIEERYEEEVDERWLETAKPRINHG